MSVLKIILLLIIFQSVVFSQSGWEHQNSGTGNTLSSVQFVNSETGFICGQFGTFLRTTNAGLNWYSIILDTTEHYKSLFFFNDSNGGMISENSFLKTTNGGNNWNSVITFGFYGLTKLLFLNSNTGFITCRGNILKTTNGGVNWIPYQVEQDVQFIDIFFTNNVTGYTTGISANIYKTTNQGLNWISYYSGINGLAYHIYFTDVNTGYVVGSYGKAAKTTNGGINWSILNTNTNHSFSSIKFINNFTGFICGINIILKTTNQGNNWTSNLFDTNNYSLLNDIQFLDENTGYSIGTKPNFVTTSLILKTTNGGGPIGITPISSEVPNDFSLSQNYPNPFNPSTKIGFEVASSSAAQTSLSVYDITGKEVLTLVNESLQPGTYEINFDASNYPSGTYFYRLQAGNYSE